MVGQGNAVIAGWLLSMVPGLRAQSERVKNTRFHASKSAVGVAVDHLSPEQKEEYVIALMAYLGTDPENIDMAALVAVVTAPASQQQQALADVLEKETWGKRF